MTDEELKALATRMDERSKDPLGDEHDAAAASAIRQLMQERDQAFEEGQRDMQLSAAEMTNDPAIFAKIYDLPILTRPLKRF
jgi:shikimate kinase